MLGARASPESIQWNWKGGGRVLRLAWPARIHSMELKEPVHVTPPHSHSHRIHSMELKDFRAYFTAYFGAYLGIHSMELKETWYSMQSIYTLNHNESIQWNWKRLLIVISVPALSNVHESIQWNWKSLLLPGLVSCDVMNPFNGIESYQGLDLKSTIS